MKTQIRKLFMVTLALIAGGVALPGSAHATEYTLKPSADAYVAQAGPNGNHGSETALRVRSSATGNGSQGFIRFTVPPLDGGVVSTKLRLRVGAKAIPQVTLHRSFMGNPLWPEATVTWNNWATNTTSFQLEQRLSLAANTWIEFDVTGNLPATGPVTFGVTSSTDASGLLFTSRETATAPQLVIVTEPGCFSEIQCGPDTYTAGAYPPGFVPDRSCTPACAQPVFAWADHFIEMERLGHHEHLNGDSFTEKFSVSKGLEGVAPPVSAMPFLESWYIPARAAANSTGPLYRLYSTQWGDHMDSRTATGEGYSTELTLGHPWLSEKPGTAKLQRFIRTTPKFDHRTWFMQPPGFSADAEWADRWGFPRFGQRIEACDIERSFYEERSNGVLDVRFYPPWGDAIGYLAFHKADGTLEQLTINTPPYMIQSLIWASSSSIPCPTCREKFICYNPAQAGAVDHWYVGNTARWMGSPVLETDETTGSVYVRESEIKPFNINSAAWQGTSSLKPLLWRGSFNVQTTLGAVIGGTAYKDVLRLRFNAKADADASAIPGLNSNMNLFLPFRLPGSGGEISQIHTVRLDVPTGNVTDLEPPNWGEGYQACSPPGGKAPVTCGDQAVIVERSDGIAYGFYAPTAPQYYKLLFRCGDGDPDPHSFCGTSYNEVFFDTFDHHKLTTTYDAAKEQDLYLVIGTFDTVKQRILSLKVLSPPSQPVATCAAIIDGKCSVNGSFTLTSSSPGAHHYQVCRSEDTLGQGGCQKVISTNTGSSYTVQGADLPSPGFGRAYYFKACNAGNICTLWKDNEEAYVYMGVPTP